MPRSQARGRRQFQTIERLAVELATHLGLQQEVGGHAVDVAEEALHRPLRQDGPAAGGHQPAGRRHRHARGQRGVGPVAGALFLAKGLAALGLGVHLVDVGDDQAVRHVDLRRALAQFDLVVAVLRLRGRGGVGDALAAQRDDGVEQALGERGELCIKGPQIMKGYWQKPEATAEVLDAEGWFKSGDIAVIDPDGFVRIVDRKKDMIIVSGFNVYPNEIEDVVMAHPKVANCAVIGVPDDRSGEAVKLFVVAREAGVSLEELKAYCKENFTAYKVPKHIVLRESLPMTPVGKILRRELRDIA